MFTHTNTITVRYGETDQMGVVYYGNYALFYETGRTEAVKSLGYSYKEMEQDGIMMPVVEMHVRYIKSAKYDDVLQVKTIINELPSRKMTFNMELYNAQEELINTGYTTLIFIDKKYNRIISPPQKLIHALQPYFS